MRFAFFLCLVFVVSISALFARMRVIFLIVSANLKVGKKAFGINALRDVNF